MKGTFSIRKEIEVDYRDFISSLLVLGKDWVCGYGFIIDYYMKSYNKAKDICVEGSFYEDILTQMVLDGGVIDFIYVENKDSEFTTEFNLEKVEKALWKYLDEQPDDAFMLAFDNIINGDYDVYDCDIVLQYILWGECVFG